MSHEHRIRFMVVDDEQSIRKLCATIAEALEFECEQVESAEAALARLEEVSPDIVLVDLNMANISGIEFLDRVKERKPQTEVAIMTGFGSIETAVRAIKLGAYDYITKPFRVDELKVVLQRMAEKVRLVAENRFLRERMSSETALHGIVGTSPRISDVLSMINRLKETRTPVLITGESGTGKELVARGIHFGGPYAKRPFVAVDCGALVPTLIESELFGYERGAFTGAMKAKAGLFQAADGGTIFLDEIGELPLEMQAKLLRVLQEKEIRRVGSNDKTKVDVRVIAATNRDLEAAYQAGTFRKDLYFRLNVVTLHLPSLRERKADISPLVYWFLDRYAAGHKMQVTPAAMSCMLEYNWPGNVRELENCIERAVALGEGAVIGIDDLPPAVRAAQSVLPVVLPQAENGATETDLEELERATIQRVFDQVGGDKTLAGKMLGISRATLYRKLKRYNIGGNGEARALSAAAGAQSPQ